MFKHAHTRKIAVIAMLSAIAAILKFLAFPVPVLIPPFVRMDFSDLPALLAAFTLGPGSGAAVCLIKNLINLLSTSSAGVGELCNFLLGASLVVPAGWIYGKLPTRKGALMGSAVGVVAMSVFTVPLNYFLIIPAFSLLMPLDTIIAMYQELLPTVDDLLTCLIIFNVPFTLLKSGVNALLAILLYRPLSPLLHKKT